MAANKRPRKQRTHRPLLIPKLIDAKMASDEHPNLALELHLAVINLIESPSVDACNELSRRMACIAGGMFNTNGGHPLRGRNDAGSIAIQSAIMVLEGIVGRHDRTGMIIVDDREAASLRSAAGVLDSVLRRITLSSYNRAVNEVDNVLGAGLM